MIMLQSFERCWCPFAADATCLLEAARGACRWGSRKRSKNRLRGARRAGLAGQVDSCDRSVQPHWCLSWNHLAKITISCVKSEDVWSLHNSNGTHLCRDQHHCWWIIISGSDGHTTCFSVCFDDGSSKKWTDLLLYLINLGLWGCPIFKTSHVK